MKSLLQSTLLAMAVHGCGPLFSPPFTAPNLVDRPRIVAIVADPPVLSPGGTVTARLALAGPPGLQEPVWTWRLCLVEQVPNEDSITSTQQDCGDGLAPSFGAAQTGSTATFRVPSDAEELSGLVESAYHMRATPQLAYGLLAMRGLDLLLSVRATVGDVVVRGEKRVVLSLGNITAGAASVPVFRFGGQYLSPTLEDPERCAPMNGSDARFRPGEEAQVEVEAIASVSPPTLSHFANGGLFDNLGARADLSRWTAPMDAGRVTHWLVAQRSADRPSGPRVSSVAFCRFEVDVR